MSSTDATDPGPSAIVHLIGYPGVGKYTVGRELVRLADESGRRLVLVDNHLTANVVLSVLPEGGPDPLPQEVWDRVEDVRSVLRASILELSPPDWSFVFTNVALEGDEADRLSIGRVAELAEQRGSAYVPVRLHCDGEEHLRRVVDPGRAERNKWRDADAVRSFVASAPLIEVHHPSVLDLDVTDRSPSDTARVVLEHVRSVERRG